MVIGIGIDIMKIERIRYSSESDLFIKRNFTSKEIEISNVKPDKAKYFAKIFAAKEAVFKSFSICGDELKTMLDIEVIEGPVLEPVVILHGEMKKIACKKQVSKVLVSLSYEDEYAVANAILLNKGGNHEFD